MFIFEKSRQFDFDVVHVHDLMILRHAAHLSREKKCPLIYDSHEIFHEISTLPKAIRKRLKREERRYISDVDLFMTVNKEISEHFRSLYGINPLVIFNCAEKRTESFYEGSREELRKQAGIPMDARVVIFHGWMSPERNLANLVRSIKFLEGDVFIVLIGYGPYTGELASVVSDLESKHRVIMMGCMENERVLRLIAGADLGIMPYLPVDLNNELCAPNKLFEFMAAGVPAVAHDLPVLRKMATEYGFIITGDLSTPEGIARVLDLVLSDPRKMELMKMKCNEAMEIFNWNVEEQKLLANYPKPGRRIR